MYIQKGNVYYSIVLCCGMYEEHCLPPNCDIIVSYVNKAVSLCQVRCVEVLLVT